MKLWGKTKGTNTWCLTPLWELHLRRLRYGPRCRRTPQLYLRTHAFIPERNEPYVPLPTQTKLILIYSGGMEGWDGQLDLGTQAPQRWVNSLLRTTTWWMSQLLAVCISPHWASRCKQLAHNCCRGQIWTREEFQWTVVNATEAPMSNGGLQGAKTCTCMRMYIVVMRNLLPLNDHHVIVVKQTWFTWLSV